MWLCRLLFTSSTTAPRSLASYRVSGTPVSAVGRMGRSEHRRGFRVHSQSIHHPYGAGPGILRPAWRRFFAELSPRPRGAGSARWASSVRAMSRFRHQYRSTVCTCSSPFVIAGNNPVAGINRSNRGCLLNPYPDAAAGRPKHPLAPTRRRPPESYIIRLCAVRIQDQTQLSQNR